MSNYVPLSVREGGMGKKLAWRVKDAREALALWIAPWLESRYRLKKDQPRAPKSNVRIR